MPQLDVEGQNIHYEVAGEGPAIVFLHGGTGDAASYWGHQVPAFAEEFMVITLDHRGYGKSGLVETKNYLESCADDIDRLLDHIGAAKAHLVGLSLGGRVALQFALQHPQRLSRLVLADTLSGVRTEKLRRFIDDVLIATARNAGMEQVFDLNLLWAFSEDYLSDHAHEFAAQRKVWAEQSAEDFANVLEATRDIDVTGELHNISAPTLVIWGSEDIEVPRVYADLLVENIVNSMMVVIAGSGHKTCVEKPSEFNRIVRTFLKGS